MPTRRRSLTAAAFGALLLTFFAAPLGAQDTNMVAPPLLKDFQLPGQRTTPPVATEAQPAPSEPAQTPPPQVTPPAQTPPPATTTTPAASRATAPARQAPRPRVAGTTPAPQAEAGPSAPATAVEPQPLPVLPVPSATTPTATAPAPAAEATAGARDWTWLYFAVPALLGLIAFFAIGRRRRERSYGSAEEVDSSFAGEIESDEAAAPEPQPSPAEAPAAAPALPSVAPGADGSRAWLEIQLTPDRAAATDTEAVVHYELILRNIGSVPARNIRIDTKLFNASDEAEMNGFMSGPIHEQSGSPHIAIDPGNGLYLVGQVAMPKESVREVRVQGRSLLIPIVAMNVAYDWEGSEGTGSGRTSTSWLVGRQPETEEAKMGAFRLDLGPRIYRSVAGREARLVKA
jgi:hypothetical protein